MSSELDAGENGAPMLAASSLPVYLRAEPEYGIVVCTEHRTAYTLVNITVHLTNSHKVSKQVRDKVQQHLVDVNVVSIVREPRHGSAPISGLQVHTGWQCNVHDCRELSQSLEVIERHSSRVHGFNSKRKREENSAVVQVSMQRWFAKSNKYWIIDTNVIARPPTTPQSTTVSRRAAFASSPIPVVSSPIISNHSSPSSRSFHPPSGTVLANLYSQVRVDHQATRRIYQEAEHPSEVTPWERTSGYAAHFRGLDLEQLNPLVAVPRKLTDPHVELYHISQSVHRVLRTPYSTVIDLHPILAQTLLSFEVERTSAKPFTFLQNVDTFKKYVKTFQSMVCYFHRLVHNNPFDRALFETTSGQDAALREMDDATEALTSYCASLPVEAVTADSDDDDAPGAEDDPERVRLESELDTATLQLLMSLIQHRTLRHPFQSVMLSFCAAASHSRVVNRWVDEAQAGSVLSKVIYCCQLVFLAQARRDSVDEDDFGFRLTKLVNDWMKKTAYGPLGDIVRLRLYPMTVARQVVNAAPIRWRSDHETLMYKDLTYRISDLTTEITFCLDHAQTLFRRDLCFDLPNIPTFNLNELEDNWDDLTPGASFLTDLRNAPTIEAYHDWLLTQIAHRPDLYDLVIQHADDHDTVGDQVRSVFAHEYERVVQDFLAYMSILMHKGSGQPGRGPEFLGLRWQNKWDGQGPRNLFVHDGYLLFLLTYHKALYRTHASRYPVRFLLPEVGQLLVQYLVLIMPLRYAFSKGVQIPPKVSEYLWYDHDSTWTQPRFMKRGRDIAQRAHGVPVDLAAWRQIAVGIAMKKFGGTQYQADLDMVGDDYDDIAGQTILESWGGAMADVFHHQAAHSVSTGNRAYGGSVNFERGLTDAGLQEYLKASRLWHQLCRPSQIR